MSSLNDLQMMAIKNLLRANPGRSREVNRTLLKEVAWSTERVNEVTKSTLQAPANKAGVEEIVSWANFLNIHMKELNGCAEPAEQSEFIAYDASETAD